jgi:putative Mg2+ transporter-C (MgtC) family protein
MAVGPEFDTELFLRLVLASFFGAIIGLEREIHGRPAGFRTHLLVSLGSCLFCICSVEFYRIFGNFKGVVPVGVDPGRIAAQVVAGIGFLGAGAIMRDKGNVRGLTTAACLWVAAALGIACGVGLYYLAITVTILSLLSLLLLKQVERRLSRDIYFTVKIWGKDHEQFVTSIYDALSSFGIDHIDARFDRNVALQRLLIEVEVRRIKGSNVYDIVDKLGRVEGVKRVKVY